MMIEKDIFEDDHSMCMDLVRKYVENYDRWEKGDTMVAKKSKHIRKLTIASASSIAHFFNSQGIL